MKKIFMLFAVMFAVSAIMAQTPTLVSTQVEKRNVVIEEFTGHNCGWCPSGHQIANEICDQYDGHAWAINIHTGGYASGSGYTTTMGDQIASLWNITGYPCGSVNRSSLQSRGDWGSTAAGIRSQDSPVNLAGQASLDAASRTFTIHLEVYFTANADEDNALLNIAVLQNNVLGHQSNYDGSNAEYIEGDMYRHMHMFRDLLTGQWGVSIPATQGSFIDTTITYVVPAAINGLDVADPSDIEFVAFVTKNNHKYIYSGAKVSVITETPVLSKFKVERLGGDCGLSYRPYVTVVNSSLNTVTSLTFDYNGSSVTRAKTIASFQSDTIQMPVYTITVSGDPEQNCLTTKTVSLESCVTEAGMVLDVNSATKSVSFADFKIYTVAGPFTARVGIDAYRSEASVQLVDQSNCTALWSEGNFGNNISTQGVQYISQLPNAGYFDISFSPNAAGLYIFRAVDSYGDGWAMTNNTNVSGIWLSNADGQFAAYPWGYSEGPAFSNFDIYLNVTNAGDGSHTVGIDEVVEAHFSIYPNPTVDRLNISSAEAVREVNVIDMAGRTVINAGATNSINVSGLAAGIYMVRVATENGIGMQKFVKE